MADVSHELIHTDWEHDIETDSYSIQVYYITFPLKHHTKLTSLFCGQEDWEHLEYDCHLERKSPGFYAFYFRCF